MRFFFMPKIRKTLMVLNGLKMTDLTGGQVSLVCMSNTFRGRRRNGTVMNQLSSVLDVDAKRLFPEGDAVKERIIRRRYIVGFMVFLACVGIRAIRVISGRRMARL